MLLELPTPTPRQAGHRGSQGSGDCWNGVGAQDSGFRVLKLGQPYGHTEDQPLRRPCIVLSAWVSPSQPFVPTIVPTIVPSLLNLAFLMASHISAVSLKRPACVFFFFTCGIHIFQVLQEPVLAAWGRCFTPVNGVEKLAQPCFSAQDSESR